MNQVQFDGDNGPNLYYTFTRCLRQDLLTEWYDITTQWIEVSITRGASYLKLHICLFYVYVGKRFSFFFFFIFIRLIQKNIYSSNTKLQGRELLSNAQYAWKHLHSFFFL